MSLWLGIIVALAVSLLTTPLAIRFAKKIGAVDLPNARKVHKEAIPRMGGIAIYLGFIFGAAALGFIDAKVVYLLVAASVIMGMGVIDDIKGLDPKTKLIIEVVAALILIKGGFYVKFITNPFDGGVISLGILSIPVSVLWLVGICNAVNLVDGLDGLSAGISAIAALTIAIVCYAQGEIVASALAAVLAASAFGFLRYNFHPARTFMGDCGSLFLGFMLGALSIMGLSKGATTVSIFIPFLIMGIPIFDTFFAIIRRVFMHKPVFEADKGHLHHRLLAMGFSHRQAVLAMYGISLFLGASAVLMAILTTPQAMILLIVVAGVVITGADRIGILRGSRQEYLLRKKSEKPQV